MTAGPYALETSYDKVWTGYSDEANGKETIFAYQASSNDGETNGNNANFGERLNFPHSGSPFGCCGFHQPSQNLVNYFRVDAARASAGIVGSELELQQRQLHRGVQHRSCRSSSRLDGRARWRAVQGLGNSTRQAGSGPQITGEPTARRRTRTRKPVAPRAASGWRRRS